MPISLIEGALGGIGLFLLGMRFMSDGIRAVADDRTKNVMSRITSNRYFSSLFGVFMALAVGSGNAAVLFTIGLFSGGVLSVYQVICVLSGVLVGASLSLHVHLIPYSLFAGPLILGGVIVKFFSRNRRRAHAATLLLGVGLLFFGLSLLEGSFLPVDHHPLYEFGQGILYQSTFMATLLGAAISFLVQSSQSTINIIASLVQEHSISAPLSFAMACGSLSGMAAMALLASVDGKAGARRIAVLLLLVTVMVNLPLVFFSAVGADVSAMIAAYCNSSDPVTVLSWGYTISSVLAAAILFVMAGPVSRRLRAFDSFFSNRSGIAQQCTGYLDRRILSTPPIALEQARKEIVHMAGVAARMYADVRAILSDFDPRRVETIRQHEQLLDSLSHEITAFLAALSNSSNSPDIIYEVPGLIQVVSALEHIGDVSEDILDCTLSRKESGIVFSHEAMEELLAFAGLVSSIISQTERIITSGRTSSRDDVQDSKARINVYHDEMQQSHFNRIRSGTCPPRSALLFQEMTSSCMRIAELCWAVMRMQLRKPE